MDEDWPLRHLSTAFTPYFGGIIINHVHMVTIKVDGHYFNAEHTSLQSVEQLFKISTGVKLQDPPAVSTSPNNLVLHAVSAVHR